MWLAAITPRSYYYLTCRVLLLYKFGAFISPVIQVLLFVLSSGLCSGLELFDVHSRTAELSTNSENGFIADISTLPLFDFPVDISFIGKE